MERVIISLGSNIGPREKHLKEAAKAISGFGDSLEVSNIYETPPWGNRNQPDFLNAAVSLNTKLSPEEFLNRLQKIEKKMGRERTVKWGPRNIDLDIIMFGNLRIEQDNLTIPHPAAKDRLFVLLPVMDLKVGSKKMEQLFEKPLKVLISSIETEEIRNTGQRLL